MKDIGKMIKALAATKNIVNLADSAYNKVIEVRNIVIK